ncbi:ketopantoate reductase family protein [Kitasatospora sp. NPDC052896]|uniref:ketopantoate reductase family protein n=1 Tax=Kitasatospora sp. NPDC052896 TaxID=3364061 RepID=UPI0037C68A37
MPQDRLLTYGARGGWPDPRLDEVHRALSGAGFDTELSSDITAAMWSKWVFIASLGAVNMCRSDTHRCC